MPIRITCSCGRKFRGPESARGRRIKCSGCGKAMQVPGDTPTTDPAASPLHQMWLARQGRTGPLGFRFPEPHLRRCMQCGAYAFGLPLPCAKCASATVGVNLADVNSGRDRAFLVALAAVSSAAARLRTLRLGVAAVAVLAAAGSFWFGAGAGVFGSVAAAVVAAGVWVAAGAVTRTSLLLLHPVLKSGPPADDPALASSLLERFIIPFLARNNCFKDSSDLIPAEQVDLLIVLLAKYGLTVKRDNVYAFLSACSLRSEYLRFRAEFAQYELSNPETFDVYVMLYPEPESDASNLPFFLQYLEEGQRRPDDDYLLNRISTRRRDSKVASLEKDLEKSAPRPNVTEVRLDDIDRIDPANFRLLAGLMYQARGWVAHATPAGGHRGADAILEKAGRKVAARMLLVTEDLGEAAVREVVEAREEYRCADALIATNRKFDAAARELAKRENVELVDREALQKMIVEFNASPRENVRLTLILQPMRREVDDVPMMDFDDDIDAVIAAIRKSKEEKKP